MLAAMRKYSEYAIITDYVGNSDEAAGKEWIVVLYTTER